MNQAVSPCGAASVNLYASRLPFIPAIPPITPQPSGTSMNESAMIRKPWKKSVQAAETSPPKKLYRMKTAVIPTTISFTPTEPPTAWLMTFPAPFSIEPMLIVK